MANGHVLYKPNSIAPIICERPNWKNCPEHKHLTNKRPNIKLDLGIEIEDNVSSVEVYSLRDYNSRGATTPQDTINIDGKVYNYNSLTDAGIAPERVREALTRPWGETGKPATKSQKENRVNFMVKEKEYYDAYDEIVNKKFGMFTSDKAKKEFYKKELKNLDDVASDAISSFWRLQSAERPEGYSYTPPRSQYDDEGEPQIESLPEYTANEKLKESWFGLLTEIQSKGGIL